jgi:hypothetical protein
MPRRGSASARREQKKREILTAAGAGGVSSQQMGQALVRQLEMEKAALIRHVEHQRCVMAIMLRRLGGYFAIHDAALLRAVQQYDVEVGNRAPLVMPDPADKEDVPQPQKGPIVFRLIDKLEQGPVEAKLQALPQRVIDLIEAAEAVIDDVHNVNNVREAMIEWLAQDADAQTPEDLAERLSNAAPELDVMADAIVKLRGLMADTNHEDNDHELPEADEPDAPDA